MGGQQHQRQGGEIGKRGLAPARRWAGACPRFPKRMQKSRMSPFLPILQLCRCQDCRHWAAGRCEVVGWTAYVPRDAGPERMRKFWSDAGMVDPAGWHYCALYTGPIPDTDRWTWVY